MKKYSSWKFASITTLLLSVAILINGCFGAGEVGTGKAPSVPSGGESSESVGPVIYKKVPNVIGMPLSAAKIKLSDTGFNPAVPGVYFGGGDRFVSAQNPPAGSLVPQTVQSVVSLTLITPKVVVVASVDTGEGAGGAGGEGGEEGGEEGAGGETTTTITTTTTEAPFADLFVVSITTDPDEPDFDEDTDIEITVKNRGTATSDIFVLRFFDGASDDASVDSSASDDTEDTSTCRFPEKENRHNRGFAPGESKIFDCENSWAIPGTYDMEAEIDFDVASADEDNDESDTSDTVEFLDDENPGNNTLIQPIKIGGVLPTTTSSTSTTSTTAPPTTSSTTTSTTTSSTTTTTLTPLGAISDGGKGVIKKFVYGTYKSSRLQYSVEYPLHWLKGVLDGSQKDSGEYFIDTYTSGIGNNIAVNREPAVASGLDEVMQDRVRTITEETGVPPLFVTTSELGEEPAYSYLIPSETAEQTTVETISLKKNMVWRVTYKADDLSYDIDRPIFDRFLKSFNAK